MNLAKAIVFLFVANLPAVIIPPLFGVPSPFGFFIGVASGVITTGYAIHRWNLV